jgi:hypothetical protein
MTTPYSPSGRWVKRFATVEACRVAAANYHWIASPGAPVPALLAAHPDRLVFEYVHGHHARPGDLLWLAELLGRVHHAAHTTDLHRARLDRPHHQHRTDHSRLHHPPPRCTHHPADRRNCAEFANHRRTVPGDGVPTVWCRCGSRAGRGYLGPKGVAMGRGRV